MLTVCIGVLGARFPCIFCFFQLHLWARHRGKVDPHGWGTSRTSRRTARTTTVPARLFLKRPVLSHTSLKKNNGQWEKWIAFLVLSLTALKLKQDFGPDKRKSSQSVDEKLRITVISGWHLKRAIGLFLFLQFRSENDILPCKRFNAGAS